MIAIFDDVDTSLVLPPAILTKIWTVVDAASASTALASDTTNTQSFDQLKLLKDFVKVGEICGDKAKDKKKRIKTCANFVARLEGYMHSEVGQSPVHLANILYTSLTHQL